MEVPVFSLGTKPIPFARFEDDESWLWRTRYGWTDNGELHKVSGSAVWETNSPPIPYLPGNDTHIIYTLGSQTIPAIDQNDDETFVHEYPGNI